MDPSAEMRYRLAVSGLTGDRLPRSALPLAARPGLQDSAPWSGLLSLHARVEGVQPDTWRDARLAQVFGPRGAIHLVPRDDVWVFTLGVLPVDDDRHAKVLRDARAVRRLLRDGPLDQRDVLDRLPELDGIRALRRAGATGTFVPVWNAVTTTLHPVPAATTDPAEARRELARRVFRHHGPAGIDDLRWHLDTTASSARAVLCDIEPELLSVGAGRYVTRDTEALFGDPPPPPPILLLPPDDPAIGRRTAHLHPPAVVRALWPKAPPPGAVLADGDVVGTWRRRGRRVTVGLWRSLGSSHLEEVERWVAGLPVPGARGPSVAVEGPEETSIGCAGS